MLMGRVGWLNHPQLSPAGRPLLSMQGHTNAWDQGAFSRKELRECAGGCEEGSQRSDVISKPEWSPCVSIYGIGSTILS